MSLLNDPGIIVAGSSIGDTRSGLSWTRVDRRICFRVMDYDLGIASICPFLSSGTHLDEGWRDRRICCYDLVADYLFGV